MVKDFISKYRYFIGGGIMIAIQPMIIEKPVPVSGGGGKMIAFPVPVAVNSNMDLSLSRG